MMVTATAQTTPTGLRAQAKEHKRQSNKHRKQARLLMQKAEELEARTGIPVRIVPSADSKPQEAQNGNNQEPQHG